MREGQDLLPQVKVPQRCFMKVEQDCSQSAGSSFSVILLQVEAALQPK